MSELQDGADDAPSSPVGAVPCNNRRMRVRVAARHLTFQQATDVETP